MSRKRDFEQIDYSIRPSKQIERRLFIEVLQQLSKAGIHISDYAYIGCGSIFYADFIMFHKYLRIADMICVEREEIPKRMEFNKPYDFIRLFMEPFSNLIPRLESDRKYLLWLDENDILTGELLDDVGTLLESLCPGCVLMITVNAEPRSYMRFFDEVQDEKSIGTTDKEQLVSAIQNEFGKYCGKIEKSELTLKRFPELLARIFRSKIETSLILRSQYRFIQLFNYKYSDGAQMLTIGGLVDKEERKSELSKIGMFEKEYINDRLAPLEISVPPLTLREKQWLDQNLEQLRGGSIAPPFEIKSSLLNNYLSYYRQYPSFHEIFI
jgi:hypothetical protein